MVPISVSLGQPLLRAEFGEPARGHDVRRDAHGCRGDRGRSGLEYGSGVVSDPTVDSLYAGFALGSLADCGLLRAGRGSGGATRARKRRTTSFFRDLAKRRGSRLTPRNCDRSSEYPRAQHGVW